MKNSVIINEDDRSLVYALSSETSWIPLSVGDYVKSDVRRYQVTEKEFDVDSDTMKYFVTEVK